MKVLIIEDDLIQQQFARLCLQGLGANQIEIADNGYNGLEKARRIIPDLVLTDFYLDDLDALDLLTVLKNDAQLREKSVIVLTASVDEDVKKKAMDAGAFAFLHKPLTKEKITLVYQQLMDMLAA